MSNDAVNHPSHYNSHPSGVECIEVTRHMTFNVGNAIKYLWRAGLKDGNPSTQDLKKAIWYLEDEIKRIEAETVKAETVKCVEAGWSGLTVGKTYEVIRRDVLGQIYITNDIGEEFGYYSNQFETAE